MFRSLTVGFETLRANPLRTILSTLGIVIGVAALVAVLSVGDGMERLAREQLGQTTDIQRIVVSTRLFRTVDDMSFPIEHPAKFTEAEARSLQETLGDSVAVNMLVGGSALVRATNDTTSYAAQVQGMLVRESRMHDSLLVAGRFFSANEGQGGAPVVTINHRLASDLAKGRDPKDVVGDTLLFQDQPRVVIGVMKAMDADRVRRALMPARAVAGAMVVGQFDRPAQLTVLAPTIEGVASIRARIESWVERQLGVGWKERVNVVSDESRLQQASRALLLFKLFMGALMSISLVVGGIGIMNVLLSSVMERTREIGIRKATGAAQRDILWQFLSESVVITGVGSMIGLVIGALSAFAITAIMRKMANAEIQAWLSPSTVLLAIGASVLVGLAFGLYPAMRAARLSPIDAIHHE